MGIWRPGEFGEDWAGGKATGLFNSMGFPPLWSPSAIFPSTQFQRSPNAICSSCKECKRKLSKNFTKVKSSLKTPSALMLNR